MAKPITANLQDSVAGPKKIEPYETENHLKTLIDAHEIVNNPDKMKAVHKLAGRHHKAISGIKSIQQLRQVANEKHMQKSQAASAPLAPMMDGANGDSDD